MLPFSKSKFDDLDLEIRLWLRDCVGGAEEGGGVVTITIGSSNVKNPLSVVAR
jgi:hypothetical protein